MKIKDYQLKAIINIQKKMRMCNARKKYKEMLRDWNDKLLRDAIIIKEREERRQNLKFPQEIGSTYIVESGLDTLLENFEEKPSEKKKVKKRNNKVQRQKKLLEAVYKNNIFILKNSGFDYTVEDVNIYDEFENTPLFYTIKKEKLDFSNYLIGLGANVNAICSEGNTPVHMAMKTNNKEVN